MFNIGPAELLIIGLVLLIAVGPEQLPGVIRRVGSTVAQFRSMTDGLRSEFMAGLDEIERATDIERWSGDESTPASSNGSEVDPSPGAAVADEASNGPDDADTGEPADDTDSDDDGPSADADAEADQEVEGAGDGASTDDPSAAETEAGETSDLDADETVGANRTAEDVVGADRTDGADGAGDGPVRDAPPGDEGSADHDRADGQPSADAEPTVSQGDGIDDAPGVAPRLKPSWGRQEGEPA